MAGQHPEIKRFTVSQLPRISSITHDDLLMVSDYDNGLRSRKMDMAQMISAVAGDGILSSCVADPASPLGIAVRNAVVEKTAAYIAEEVRRQLSNSVDLCAFVLRVVGENNRFVADVLDGRLDDTFVIGENQEV